MIIYISIYPLLVRVEQEGPDLYSCLKQPQKPDKIFETTVFKSLKIRQRRTVILERRKDMRWNLWSPPPYGLRVFPGCGAERGAQAEPRGLPELGRQIWESEGTKATRDSWSEYQRGEMYTMREFCEDLQKVPLKYLGEYWSKHVCD